MTWLCRQPARAEWPRASVVILGEIFHTTMPAAARITWRRRLVGAGGGGRRPANRRRYDGGPHE
jgi:hypothetical protein